MLKELSELDWLQEYELDLHQRHVIKIIKKSYFKDCNQSGTSVIVIVNVPFSLLLCVPHLFFGPP